MKFKKINLTVLTILFVQLGFTQEGIPIYSDYLTDNYYLIHPSMAGIANCAKARLTARQQWFGIDNAPSLQALSVNGRVGDSPVGLGGVFYNDANGYHSNVGGHLTFAYHLMFSRNEIDLNMLSFGVTAGFIQNKLDETEFLDDGLPDPSIAGIEQSATNFNVDFGFSYHYLDLYAHFTVKNVLENRGINFNEQGLSYNNMLTYLGSVGYNFSKYSSKWSYEPSVMLMFREATQELSIDINAKIYREMDFGKLWGGLSYRQSFDEATFLDGASTSTQKLQYFTPFLGLEHNQFIFAYTYSYQSNSIVFNNSGFHQFTLGYNFNCKKKKFECNCPAIN